MNPTEFIQTIGPAARDLQLKNGIFASVTMAQAALETGWGRTIPTDLKTGQDSYNLFGVKGIGPAGSVVCPTKEFENGEWVTINANFRAYHNWLESLADHEAVLSLDRYAPARAAKTPQEQAMLIQSCGYATDPDYSKKLIQIMEEYNLYQLNEVNPMKQEDVQAILETLGGHWRVLTALGLTEEAEKVHLQANQMREAYGLPTT